MNFPPHALRKETHALNLAIISKERSDVNTTRDKIVGGKALSDYQTRHERAFYGRILRHVVTKCSKCE